MVKIENWKVQNLSQQGRQNRVEMEGTFTYNGNTYTVKVCYKNSLKNRISTDESGLQETIQKMISLIDEKDLFDLVGVTVRTPLDNLENSVIQEGKAPAWKWSDRTTKKSKHEETLKRVFEIFKKTFPSKKDPVASHASDDNHRNAPNVRGDSGKPQIEEEMDSGSKPAGPKPAMPDNDSADSLMDNRGNDLDLGDERDQCQHGHGGVDETVTLEVQEGAKPRSHWWSDFWNGTKGADLTEPVGDLDLGIG